MRKLGASILELARRASPTRRGRIAAALARARRAAARRRWNAAGAAYQSVLSLDPSLTPAWVQYGHCLKEAGALQGAEAAYRRALDFDASVADTHLQLGHLMKMCGRHSAAESSYVQAVRLDPRSVHAREALTAFVGYSPGEYDRVLAGRSLDGDRDKGAFAWTGPADGSLDIVWLGGIDWHYRAQRPQHLVSQLAALGGRVCYVSPTFEPACGRRFRVIDHPQTNVAEIRLCVAGDALASIHRGLSREAADDTRTSLRDLVIASGFANPVLVLGHPGWGGAALQLDAIPTLYDCVDLHSGFDGVTEDLLAAEAAVIAGADVVVCASAPLVDKIASRSAPVLIRNGADVAFFARGRRDGRINLKPVIGYVGAIAGWFEAAWIGACAQRRSEWEFHLIGRPEGEHARYLSRFANVRLLGELPYSSLPDAIRTFDVATIPFRMTELIRCTNPVKLYEYMASGKPIVSARMPEVAAASELIYLADDPRSFERQILLALEEDSEVRRNQRQSWARAHDWRDRALQFKAALQSTGANTSVS